MALGATGRWIVSIGIAAVLAAAFSLVSMEARPEEELAKEWVSSHADRLPKSLEELAAYPDAYRLESFKHLTEQEKSQLWREQTRRFLRDEQALTSQQVRFVHRLIELATPESFTPEGYRPDDLCNELAAAFPDLRQRRVFRSSSIGLGATPQLSFQSSWVNLSVRLRGAVVVNARIGQCHCRNNGYCECPSEHGLSCCFDYPCYQTESCGCIWTATCNRMCYNCSIGLPE
jgi:hypothetical protein